MTMRQQEERLVHRVDADERLAESPNTCKIEDRVRNANVALAHSASKGYEGISKLSLGVRAGARKPEMLVP